MYGHLNVKLAYPENVHALRSLRFRVHTALYIPHTAAFKKVRNFSICPDFTTVHAKFSPTKALTNAF